MSEPKDQKLAERNIPGAMNRGQRFVEVQHAKDVKGTLKRIAMYFVREKAIVFGMLAIVILSPKIKAEIFP